MMENETYAACFNCTAIGKIQYFHGFSDGVVTIYFCDNCIDELESVEAEYDNLFPFPQLGGLDDDDIPF